MAQEHRSTKLASQILKIPEKNIKRWIRNGPERKKGAGRKCTDQNMEVQLLQWIEQIFRDFGQLPDIRSLKIRAKELANNSAFKASKGWCDKFMKRNKTYFDQLSEDRKIKLSITDCKIFS